VTAKFELTIEFNPENQPKSSVIALLKGIGVTLKLPIEVAIEFQADKPDRSDPGIAVNRLLAGHGDLKAP